MRVFTYVDDRKAPEDEIRSFESEAEMGALRGAGEIDEKSVQQFPTVEKMASMPGKKEGEMKVFREGTSNNNLRYGAQGLHVEGRQVGVYRRGHGPEEREKALRG